jgi:hypothetical protein
MKHTMALIALLVLLMPVHAYAEHFNCELTLGLIDDTNSSETKKIQLEVEYGLDFKNILNGALVSISCFNTITETFTSNSSILELVKNGDLPSGSFQNSSLLIGKYHYQMNLIFSQFSTPSENSNVVNFVATGKLLPLDNSRFIHQNVEGQCHLTQEEFL